MNLSWHDSLQAGKIKFYYRWKYFYSVMFIGNHRRMTCNMDISMDANPAYWFAIYAFHHMKPLLTSRVRSLSWISLYDWRSSPRRTAISGQCLCLHNISFVQWWPSKMNTFQLHKIVDLFKNPSSVGAIQSKSFVELVQRSSYSTIPMCIKQWGRLTWLWG